jgi:subtilisin family serine protease/subtilisin-like proprotein convertase family protein
MLISKLARRAVVRASFDAVERRILLATVSGQVFYDDNFDGLVGSGENGVGGWAVFADLNNNGQLDGQAVSRTSSDVPKAINDNSTVLSSLPITGVAGTVADVDVEITLTHTYVGDLDITVIAPDGTRVQLANRRGGAGDNMTGTIFDDQANTAWSTVTSSSAPFSNRYRPEQPLSNLTGKAIAGTWQLEVADRASIDTGSLLGWSLHFRDGEPSAISSSNGTYSLQGLPAGDVTVYLEPQSSWNHQRLSASLSLPTASSSVTGVNFGVRQTPGSVSGHVFADYSRDGVRDPNEPGIAERVVYLDTNNNAALDAGEVSTLTDSNGYYSFNDLRPGSYNVRQVLPNRWFQTSPSGAGELGSTESTPTKPAPQYLSDRLILAVGKRNKLEAALRKLDNRSLRVALPLWQSAKLASLDSGLTVLQVPVRAGHDPLKLASRLTNLPGVAWAQPDFVFVGDARDYIPNDPQFSSQYHHTNMRNAQAWDVTEGQGIVVAVADDGVMLSHPDLAANIWVNTGEIPGNGIDDDGNGYVDDVNGWDFTNSTGLGTGDNNPNPVSSGDDHGTHVAGIVAARTNNGVGVAGTAGRATIMPLRFYGSGSWTSTVIFNSYKYAADNGAHIVTTSYNVDGFANDNLYRSAIDYLYTRNVLHLNSAGNAGALNPARQVIDGTLYVASTDSGDLRSSFSNYGTGIDIAAPGSNILSTAIGSTLTSATYESKSGTSMATPNAAAVAALIWSANPTWTRDQVAAQLLGTADNIDALNSSTAGLLGAGRVNSVRGVTQTLAAPRLGTLTGLPAEGGTATTSPTSFTLRFTSILDAVTVNNAAAFRLVNAGNDDVFGTSDDFAVTLNRSVADYRIGTNQMTFTVASPLVAGSWRFIADAAVLRDPFGQALDGNSDGTGGDSLVRNFSITGITAAHSVTLAPGQVGDLSFGVRETIAPTIVSSVFGTETEQFVAFTFSEPMNTTPLTTGAVTISNTTTSQVLDPSMYTFAYDHSTNTFQVGFAGAPIPNGDYRATFNRSSAIDRFGNVMAADASLSFFFKNGDFNRDRSTGFDDLLTIAQNYGSTSATFAEGDADFDGTIGFSDLLIVAQQYNTSLIRPVDGGRLTRTDPRSRSTLEELV